MMASPSEIEGHHGSERNSRRAGWRTTLRTLFGLAIVLALFVAWAWGPLRETASPEAIVEATRPFAEQWWALPAATVGFAVSALLFAPMTLLMVVLVLLFGPWQAFFVGWLGAVLSAAAGHTVGRFFWRQSIGLRFRDRFAFMAEALAKNEIRSTVILRLIPMAPFTLINLAAGSLRIGLRNFVVGTLVGAVPVIALLTFASDQVLQAVRNPSSTSVAIAAIVVIALGLLALVARRLGDR